MAVKEQKVTKDSPSVVLDQLRREFNNLLTEIDAAADFSALQTALATKVRKIVTTLSYAEDPKIAVL